MRGLGAALTAALAAAFTAAPAAAEDPPFVGWSPLLPPLVTGITPSAERDCADGDPTCIDRTLVAMERRFRPLLARCDHNAVFALTYIRVTEAYRRADRSGFIEERDFLAHEDAVFARMYFDAYDNWARGDRHAVPPAWREAFDRAATKEQFGLGSMLHGMNAHVNRDMPIMLAALGLVRPDGRSRKPDHDRFNQLLNEVYDDVLAEITTRFDPWTDDFSLPGTLVDDMALFQLLPVWREAVWRHAELLTAARGTDAQRAVVAHIEAYAADQAKAISAFYGFGPGGITSAPRDAHCAGNARLDPTVTPGREDDLAVPDPSAAALRPDRLGSLRVPLSCRAEAIDCPGRLTLERRGAVLGSGAYALSPASRDEVEVRLNRGGRRLLRRGRVLRARAVSRMEGDRPVARDVRLRAAR